MSKMLSFCIIIILFDISSLKADLITLDDTRKWFLQYDDYYTNKSLRSLTRLVFDRYPHSKYRMILKSPIYNKEKREIIKKRLNTLPEVKNDDFRYLKPLINLKTLYILEMRCITENAFVHLVNLEKLSMLLISDIKITTKGLKYLSKIKALEFLDIGENRLGPKRMIKKRCYLQAGVNQSLKDFKNLKRLNLSGIKEITNEDIIYLIELKQLDSLNIVNTSIGYKYALMLSKNLPQCTIYTKAPFDWLHRDNMGYRLKSGKIISKFSIQFIQWGN